MTDITDQDRRDARAWAEKIDPTYRGNSRPLLNAARVILATVDAPEPTLAEDILDAAARIRDAVNPGDRDVSWADMESCANRAEQIEQDRDEARAEVERLDAVAEDYARRATAALTERDEARAEVERLAAYRNAPLPMPPGDIPGTALPIHIMQKGAESNAESPDPADVNPGEAWLVEVRGERRTAVKDGEGSLSWNTVNAGGYFLAEYGKNVNLIARLVPAPRVITNPDELDRAKRLTVIRDGMGVVCERAPLGDGWFTTSHGTDQTPYIKLPATVLWEPEA